MKSIKSMVEEALLDSVTQDDIESAVESIVDGIDIGEYLSENEVLRDAVYSAVGSVIDNIVEAFL